MKMGVGKFSITTIIVLGMLWHGTVAQQQRSASEILAIVDRIMGPQQFTALMEMKTLRPDGTEKIYRMNMFRRDAEVTRIEFIHPPVEKGRVLLRKEQDMWMKMPSLKRPLRIAAKQQLMNGDFDNGDVMRLNLIADYTPSIQSDEGDTCMLELTAKDRSVAYDRVHLWVRSTDCMPLKARYFTVSGAPLRELEYGEVTKYGNHLRPSRLIMRNLLNKKSFSEMKVIEFKPGLTLEESMFTVESM
ncbi:MAG: outer membrane lipoprotein-sorting protein [Chitinivibrionales bacterium]|nr:outer membrane lipoprotein-sorting protein [Chitinivibrionales bacterium]